LVFPYALIEDHEKTKRTIPAEEYLQPFETRKKEQEGENTDISTSHYISVDNVKRICS
jgi:hypothetical protein